MGTKTCFGSEPWRTTAPREGAVEMLLVPVLEMFRCDRREMVVTRSVLRELDADDNCDDTGAKSVGEREVEAERRVPLPWSVSVCGGQHCNGNRDDPLRVRSPLYDSPQPNLIPSITLAELLQAFTDGSPATVDAQARRMLLGALENAGNPHPGCNDQHAWTLFFGYLQFVTCARLIPAMPAPADQQTYARHIKRLLEGLETKQLLQFPAAVTHAQAQRGRGSQPWWWQTKELDGLKYKWPLKANEAVRLRYTSSAPLL